MQYTVSELSGLCGLTVRTLHHYDEIGLLKPAHRSKAGHRLYADDDVARLQEILYLKELGLGLGEIHRVLDDPHIDKQHMLALQRRLLVGQISKLEAMVEAIDAAAQNGKGTITMEDMKEIFGGFDPSEYEAEVEERWGHSDAYAESKRRTGSYRKEDWQRIMAEATAIGSALGALMEAGGDPGADTAMDLAEAHRRHISDNFYECPPAMHAQLGDMYVADQRFTATWEKISPGLTAFVQKAWRANAKRQGA